MSAVVQLCSCARSLISADVDFPAENVCIGLHFLEVVITSLAKRMKVECFCQIGCCDCVCVCVSVTWDCLTANIVRHTDTAVYHHKDLMSKVYVARKVVWSGVSAWVASCDSANAFSFPFKHYTQHTADYTYTHVYISFAEQRRRRRRRPRQRRQQRRWWRRRTSARISYIANGLYSPCGGEETLPLQAHILTQTHTHKHAGALLFSVFTCTDEYSWRSNRNVIVRLRHRGTHVRLFLRFACFTFAVSALIIKYFNFYRVRDRLQLTSSFPRK